MCEAQRPACKQYSRSDSPSLSLAAKQHQQTAADCLLGSYFRSVLTTDPSSPDFLWVAPCELEEEDDDDPQRRDGFASFTFSSTLETLSTDRCENLPASLLARHTR